MAGRPVRARTPQACYEKLQKIALAVPDTEECVSHARPWFRKKGGKMFAAFLDNHHGDGRVAMWCKAEEGAQKLLVDSDPDVYFVPPYVGPYGWIGVCLDRADWSAVAALLTDAAHLVTLARKPARSRKTTTKKKPAPARVAKKKTARPRSRT